jgi:Ca2+-binding RTX toxin-like protein
MPYQGANVTKSTTATLTGAELVTGILTTTGTNYTITLPSGANIESALTWAASNVALDFFIVNTATGTITINANSNTLIGNSTVATNNSAQLRIRRTATNTFTVYRLR